jgi:hypothetical protein
MAEVFGGVSEASSSWLFHPQDFSISPKPSSWKALKRRRAVAPALTPKFYVLRFVVDFSSWLTAAGPGLAAAERAQANNKINAISSS